MKETRSADSSAGSDETEEAGEALAEDRQHPRWLRAGRTLGRTLYLMTPGDDRGADTFIGTVDTRELAEWIVQRVNGAEAADDLLAAIRDYATSLPEVRQAGYGLGRIRDDLLGILDQARQHAAQQARAAGPR